MTILITADWHLDDAPINAYRHAFQKQLRAIVKEHGVKLCVILGDLCDQKDRHSAWLVNEVVDHLYRLSCVCENVVIVRGNHDYVDANNPFFEFAQHLSGIHWINEPTDANGAHLSLEFSWLMGKTLLLPHATNYKKDWKGLKLKDYNWVFTHNTFADADAGRGFMLKGIPCNVFRPDTVVFSGDIHVPQTLQGHVTYVGAPYLCDFGDDYEPRVIVYTKNGRLSIPVTGPQKRLVEGTLDEILDGEQEWNDHDILKVRIKITSKERTQWPEIKARVREWGERHDYLIHLVQPLLTDAERGVAERPQHKQQSDDQLLRSYAKHRDVDDLTLKAGLSLLRRV